MMKRNYNTNNYSIDNEIKINIKTKVIVISVFLFGICAHLYMFMNRIVNHDSVFSTNYSGSTFTSGRWFLGLLSEISYKFDGNYVSPWKIGLISLAIYAIVVYFLVKIFSIKQLWICGFVD